jgi:hypothetical protein
MSKSDGRGQDALLYLVPPSEHQTGDLEEDDGRGFVAWLWTGDADSEINVRSIRRGGMEGRRIT